MPDEIEIPEPIGSHILRHKKITGVITEGGYYYHYSDVCTLLKEHEERVLREERERLINKNIPETTILGMATTVGHLRKMIEPFPDETSFGFFNQPLQSLYSIKYPDQTFIVFKESHG